MRYIKLGKLRKQTLIDAETILNIFIQNNILDDIKIEYSAAKFYEDMAKTLVRKNSELTSQVKTLKDQLTQAAAKGLNIYD